MKVRKLFIIALLSGVLPLVAVTQHLSEDSVYVPHRGQAGKDVIWVPTPLGMVHLMLDKAKVGPADNLVDLGSGDGRFVIEAAKRGIRAVGIEYNADMVKLSVQQAEIEEVSKLAKFMQMDLFEYDFSHATVVSLYLLPELNMKLRPKLLDLQPGTRIVSNSFNLGNWTADETFYFDEQSGHETGEQDRNYYHDWEGYLWIVPAKVEGTWRFGNGELHLTQKFQMVEGVYNSDSGSFRIGEGRLKGKEISFKIRNAVYKGTVEGNHIKGTFTEGNSENKWEATLKTK